MPKEALVSLKGINKQFLDITAEQDVSVDIFEREVLGLLGENGAGKSTLMKILYGLYQPDGGEIVWKGKKVHVNSPREAIDRGIGMVHQHFTLVDHHTVLENVIIGSRSVCRFGVINFEAARKRLTELSSRYGLAVEPDRRVSDLSVGEKQRVEILKALFRDVSLLILDEPTAVLTPQEVESLFAILKQLVEDGLSVVFISHKLNEVLRITNRVVVMRRGRVVGEAFTRETTQEELTRMMVGGEGFFPIERQSDIRQEPLLSLAGIRVEGDTGHQAVFDLSLEVMSGQVVGIAGVSGNGQRELSEALAGVRPIRAGRVRLGDREITNATPSKLVESRVARVPEDRMGLGLILDFTVAENLIVERLSHPDYRLGPLINWSSVLQSARSVMKQFDIRAPTPTTVTRTLSGGNIQKTLLGRELSIDPMCIIASQPTRGLDLHATNYVHHLLLEKRNSGAAVLLISEDLDELFSIADVIAVMYHGEITGLFDPATTTRELVGMHMLGIRRQTPEGAVE